VDVIIKIVYSFVNVAAITENIASCLCCSIYWKFQSGKADVMTFRFQTPFSYSKMQLVSIRLWLTASCRRIPM